MQDVKRLVPDVLFLDINMPELNGIEFTRLITGPTKIVLTTGSVGYAVEAFEMATFDYLLKPISYARFQKCVARLSTKAIVNSGINDFLYVKSDKGKMFKVDYDEILYVESDNNHVAIVTNKAKHLAYLTMKEVDEQLPKGSFMRVNKSFLINFNKIDHVYGNQIVLIDKTVLQVGNTYRATFFELINRYAIQTGRE